MLITHYDIRMPRDYDMQIVRDRVATRGHALDDYPGLGAKAYLLRDVTQGSDVNAYAPFYLWADDRAAARFFWGGDGFGGIVNDFTRPAVRTFIGGGYHRGPADTALFANVMTEGMTNDVDPEEIAEHTASMAQDLATAEDVHSVAWGIDPTSWDVVVLVLASSRTAQFPAASRPTSYEVLHLSAPGLEQLS